MSNKATVNYHIKSPDPQAFHFDVGGIAGNLVSPDLVPTDVHVRDIRGSLTGVEFDTDGVIFASHQSQVRTFDDPANWQDTYNDELTDILKAQIGAKEVIVFDHTVRVDDQNAERRPARNVHNDYSEKGAHQRLIDLVGTERAADFRGGQFGFVNVWRPVKHTIKTSPLGFIRPASMTASDWMNIELVYPDRFGQILGVAASADHDWFYLSEMTPDEVVIFNIYDNQGRPHLAHSALDMHDLASVKAPRMSIESRTLARYD